MDRKRHVDLANLDSYRIERDSIGEKLIPKDAYYGIQTERAYDNFRISGQRIEPEFIIAIAEVKKACAITNFEVGIMDETVEKAISQACDDVIARKFDDEFIVDPIQGGAGTSLNMNANEVIANRANQILGGEIGVYDRVHPNDDVNQGQSTNDVYPTAGKIAVIRLMTRAQENLRYLCHALERKGEEFNDVIKMGRTQMQDAIPIRLGQEFMAYHEAVQRDLARFDLVIEEMKYINMGGTAIGTGLNADVNYMKRIVPNLQRVTRIDLKKSANLIDGTQNLDRILYCSGMVKTCAATLSKIANDIRLMSSGPTCGFGEIDIPAKQAGSSIMPGKVNPVIPEVMNQVAFNIIGNDTTITMAVEAGQLELNAFEPIIFYKLFESIRTLMGAVETFTVNCIDGINAKENKTRNMVENSIGIITAISPHIGYEVASDIAKESLHTGTPIRELLLSRDIIGEDELNQILDIFQMTQPGISAEELVDRRRLEEVHKKFGKRIKARLAERKKDHEQ